MTTESKYSSVDIIAKIISAVLHPLFIPVYGLLIIFSAPTLFGYLPLEVKKILILVVLINNVLLPVSLLPWFRYRNIISSWTMIERKERVLPLFTTTLFYSITVYILMKFHIPLFIKSFILVATLLSVALTIINFWHKISIHSTGAGALLSLVIVLSIKMQVPLTWFLTASLLSAGLVMTARLWLNSHKPSEVWSGFLLGSAGCGIILMLF